MTGRIHLIGAILGSALSGVVALPALAGEYVVLDNGFRLHADRHEQVGDAVRLYDSTGTVEIPARRVAGYEVEEGVTSRPDAQAIAPAPHSDSDSLQEASPLELAHEAAEKLKLPWAFESLVRSVMKAESALNPAAVSAKGAIGLMQLMPGTAKDLNVNPRVPRENTNGGARYLRDLLARYEGRPDQVILALAAYNAGPEAVEKYHGVPPFRETHEYILRVLKNWQPDLEKLTRN